MTTHADPVPGPAVSATDATAGARRIAAAFGRARGEGRVALIPYVVAGYPDADANASRHVFNPDNRAEAKQTMFLCWRASFAKEWFNDAVERARLERDEEKRKQLYYEIQERFMVEGPFMYNFQQVRQLAMRKEVSELKHHAFRVYYTTARK